MSDHALNAEIALALGFEWRLGGSIGHKCRFLSPPDTAEGRELVGVNYPTYTMDQAFPPATEADKLCRDWDRFVPAYDTDTAAALSLLEYVLAQRTDHGPFVLHRIERNRLGKWLVLVGVDGSGESIGHADTLPLAIARACRDVLEALRAAG